METRPLHAVHDRDLVALLDRLGIKHRLDAGKLRCGQCSEVVTMECLGGLYYQSGQVRVLCSNAACIDSFRGAE